MMFDKKQLTILIIAVVVALVVGMAIGIMIVKAGPEKIKVQTVNSLASKTITQIQAYGQVKSINGRDITLSNLGDDLKISIANNAQVVAFTVSATDKNKTPVQKTAVFGDIKVGDKVNVTMKLLADGQLEGSSVVILPQTK